MLNSKSGNHLTKNSNAHSTQNTRVDELLNTITEARKSLETWQDKRTEALIHLDALSYDIRIIEEEKSRTTVHNSELQEQLTQQARVYESHVETLTEQMQVMKLEKEELVNELTKALAEVERQKSEVERQLSVQAQMQEEHVKNIAQAKADTEIRFFDQQHQMKNHIVEMATQIDQLVAARNEAEKRAAILEHELSGIRNQMLNVLRVNEAPATDPRSSEARNEKSKAGSNDSSNGSAKLRAVEIEPSGSSTVQDYLKRFGY